MDSHTKVSSSHRKKTIVSSIITQEQPAQQDVNRSRKSSLSESINENELKNTDIIGQDSNSSKFEDITLREHYKSSEMMYEVCNWIKSKF